MKAAILHQITLQVVDLWRLHITPSTNTGCL